MFGKMLFHTLGMYSETETPSLNIVHRNIVKQCIRVGQHLKSHTICCTIDLALKLVICSFEKRNDGRQNEGYRGQALEKGLEDACGHGSNIPFRSQDDKNLNLIFKIKFWCWSVNKTFRPAEESMKKNISLIQTSKCCSKFKRITLKLCLNLLFCVKLFKSCQCHLKF